MQKENCLSCGLNGNDSGVCKEKACFKLFGVNIFNHQSTKRSISMGNLHSQFSEPNYHQLHISYHSESEGQVSPKRHRMENKRQKPKPWTEEEHQKFLHGLKTTGKGKWKRISESYVPTKTPMQVASHAQKFFLRKASSDKKTKRSSIFDSPSEEFALDPLQDSPLAKKISYQASSSSFMPLEQPPSEIQAQLAVTNHVAMNSPYNCPSYGNVPGNENLRTFAIPATPITVDASGVPGKPQVTFPHVMLVAAPHPKISAAENFFLKPLE